MNEIRKNKDRESKIFKQIIETNLISLMLNKDSEKIRSNSDTKFVPFKLYLVHRRS